LLALKAQLRKLNNKKGRDCKSTKGNISKGNPHGDRPDWMSVKHSAEEIAAGYKKKVDNVEYQWCDHHQWSKLAKQECHAKDKPNKAPLASHLPTNSPKGHKTLRALNAIASRMDELDKEKEA
jgi:hypothetical protein